MGGTLIATENGLEEIQNVKRGDRVWSHDGECATWELQEVEQTFVHAYEGDVITLILEEATIEATANHPFWVVEGEGLRERPQPHEMPVQDVTQKRGGRWLEARSLRVGDVLLSRTAGHVAVKELREHIRRVPVYNIQVEVRHCYAVSYAGVLVHDKPAKRGSLSNKEEYGTYDWDGKTSEERADIDHDALKDRKRREMAGFESGRHDEYPRAMERELRRMADEADALEYLPDYGRRLREIADTYAKRAREAHRGGRTGF